MRDTRLILIEGLPGSGKSTTAQWLSHVLEALGVASVWLHEQDIAHPVYPYDELQAATRAGRAACLAYHEGARRRWKTLVEKMRSGTGVTILEGSFFQAPVASMQLCQCETRDLARHVAETETILAPLKPALIVLWQEDVSIAYQRLQLHRGPDFEPFLLEFVRSTAFGAAYEGDVRPGVLELMRAYARTVEELRQALTCAALRVDVSAGRWDDYRPMMLRFLGLPHLEPYTLVEGASRFTGRYCELHSDQELVVDTDERGLFLQPMGTRLLPRRRTSFEIEGLSIELTFEELDGERPRILCASRLANLGPVWVRRP